MKKTTVFIIAILLFAAIIVTQEVLTGKMITGRTPSQSTDVSIFVLSATPTLSILSPEESKTYLTTTSLLLSYSVSNEDDMWYNLDDGSNISITTDPPIYFNSPIGTHTLYLFAENQYGINESNVTFYVNTTQVTIEYDEFQGTYEGNSTDFLVLPFEDIQNISDITFEDTRYGKIFFNERINLTADETPDDNIISLDDYINISTNRVEVNTTALPNFMKAATLQLYGLTFDDPRILKDGAVCSDCTEESYSGGILIFNVTSFSVYSSEETPSGSGVTGGGVSTGGSIGGGGTVYILSGEEEEVKETLVEKALSYIAEAPPAKRAKIVASTVLMSAIVFLIVLMINLSGVSLGKYKPK